jgi:hypothetical protein
MTKIGRIDGAVELKALFWEEKTAKLDTIITLFIVKKGQFVDFSSIRKQVYILLSKFLVKN